MNMNRGKDKDGGRGDMIRRAMEKNIRGSIGESYSSLEYRDLANLLLTRLVEGYGYDNKVQVARKLVKLVNDFLELVEENTPSMDMVRPGQICWLARSIESRAGPEKDARKVLVKLTVVGQEGSKEVSIIHHSYPLKCAEIQVFSAGLS